MVGYDEVIVEAAVAGADSVPQGKEEDSGGLFAAISHTFFPFFL